MCYHVLDSANECYHHRYGIVLPYLVLLLVAVYFSLHIVIVAISQTKNRCAVAPAHTNK